MAKSKQYEVEMTHLAASGAKKTMWRAGRQFEVKVPQVLELTNEEVEAFENDKRFSIKEASDAPQPSDNGGEASDSQEDTPEAGDASSEANDSSEGEDSQDTASDASEEDNSSDTPETETVESLLKNNSRDELNARAEDLGVQSPENLKDKTEVAQAIVDAEARNSNSEATS